jgi:hypothetical protein
MTVLQARLVVISLAAAAVAFEAHGLAGQQATFRAGIDLVNFGITVTDKKGTFIDDLGIDDFEILEDGKKQTPSYFARGDQTTAAPPLHVGLLFDTSGSMGEDIKLARSAAVRFLNTPKSGWRNTARRISRDWWSGSVVASRRGGRRCTTRSACFSTALPRTKAARSWSSTPTAVIPAAPWRSATS